MSKALDYLIEDKKQELKADWLKNTFVRYKIVNTRNSLSEAILRSFHRGEYKRTYRELEKFYEQVIDHLKENSDLDSKEIYIKIFQDERLKKYMRDNRITLVKPKDNDLRNLGFYFQENQDSRFYFFPKELRQLNEDCNLMKYFASIDIELPYNYFKIRFREKYEYIKIQKNIREIKDDKKKELCNPTIETMKEKRLINHYLSFSKNLFSDKKKEDFKFYLFLYPKIFKINLMIFIPFKDNIVVQNIIEEDKNYPYLILFQPLESISYYFKIELGALLIDRRLNYLLDPKKDSDIIDDIKSRYYSKENNNPIINYLKYQRDNKESKYLKDYDFDNKDNKELYSLLEKLKYYSYEL